MSMAFALLMLCLCMGGALALAILACSKWKYMVQEKRCTAKTTGTVSRYSWWAINYSYCLPCVDYQVDGKRYMVRGPEYRSYVTMTRSGPRLDSRMRKPISEEAKQSQRLRVSLDTNSFVSIKAPAREMYPIGTKLDVFYDPNNPKLAYVMRYCNLKWMFWMFSITAAALAVTGLMIFAPLWSSIHYTASDGTPALVEAGDDGTHLVKTGDSTFDITFYNDKAGKGIVETKAEYESDMATCEKIGDQVQMPSALETNYGTVYQFVDGTYAWFGQSGNSYLKASLADDDALYYALRNISLNGDAIGS